MYNKYLFFNIITVISILCLKSVRAQCLDVKSCDALGYTEISCPNGGIKCPFGNTWSCNSTCDEAYKYTCSEEGYIGTVGTPCNGKYVYCSCADGYDLDGCQQLFTGAKGDLFYCRGEVTGVKTADMNFYISLVTLGPNGPYTDDDYGRGYKFCDNLSGYQAGSSSLGIVYKNKGALNSLLTKYGDRKLQSRYWTGGGYTGHSEFFNMSNNTTDYVRTTDGSNKFYVLSILTSW